MNETVIQILHNVFDWICSLNLLTILIIYGAIMEYLLFLTIFYRSLKSFVEIMVKKELTKNDRRIRLLMIVSGAASFYSAAMTIAKFFVQTNTGWNQHFFAVAIVAILLKTLYSSWTGQTSSLNRKIHEYTRQIIYIYESSKEVNDDSKQE